MTPLQQLDRFLLSSSRGRIALIVVCGTWYGVRRSELERAASETRSTDLEDRLRDLMLTTRNQSVAAAERAEEAAVGALRSSLCGLEAQAASPDVAAATTARDYLALLERKGLTVSPGDPAAGSEPEEPLA
jgi:hypothetical protein